MYIFLFLKLNKFTEVLGLTFIFIALFLKAMFAWMEVILINSFLFNLYLGFGIKYSSAELPQENHRVK